MKADVAVIGAGPAGLAAAIAAKQNGAHDVVVIDRERLTGGILRQCIHNGFGLHIFGEELTGPEYAARFSGEAKDVGIMLMMETMVLDVTKDRQITAVGKDAGLLYIEAGAIVLAMGCRERSRGALMIPGERPSGVLTAGTAQRFVNIEGYMPGQGSCDSRLRRYWTHHGAAYDAGGCARENGAGAAAVFGRADPKHRAVP